jgi:ferredoxin
MYKLSVDQSKCKQCGTCEALLPGFKQYHHCGLMINDDNGRQEEIMAAVERVKKGCVNCAIVFKGVTV